MLVVVMGVCGAGKTTVGRALARALPARFVDADEHGDMLARLCDLATTTEAHEHVVIACALLDRHQRDAMRARLATVRLVYLHPSMATLVRRRASRCREHDVVAQLRRLEPPGANEGAMFIANEDPVETVAARILSALVLEIDPGADGTRMRH